MKFCYYKSKDFCACLITLRGESKATKLMHRPYQPYVPYKKISFERGELRRKMNGKKVTVDTPFAYPRDARIIKEEGWYKYAG